MRAPGSFLAAISLFAAVSGPLSAEEPAKAALDGMVFVGQIDVEGYDKVFEDRMIFENGTFLSEECQRICDFGKTAYFTRQEGDAIAFVVQTRCKDAPYSVEWHGRVTGNRVEGTAIWTTSRFYWTVQRHGTFRGELEPGTASQASIVTQ